MFIYHLSPAELNEPEEDSVIRFERLDEFANPEKNFEFGIARFPLSSEEISKMISHLDSLRLQKVSFDFLFDLSTKNKMYCSEMIDDCIRFATHDFSTGRNNPNQYPVLQAAALNQSGSYKGGTFSTGYFPNPNDSYGQYGLVKVNDAGDSTIEISMTGFRVNSNGNENVLTKYAFKRTLK